jgi:hypothetical protein
MSGTSLILQKGLGGMRMVRDDGYISPLELAEPIWTADAVRPRHFEISVVDRAKMQQATISLFYLVSPPWTVFVAEFETSTDPPWFSCRFDYIPKGWCQSITKWLCYLHCESAWHLNYARGQRVKANH